MEPTCVDRQCRPRKPRLQLHFAGFWKTFSGRSPSGTHVLFVLTLWFCLWATASAAQQRSPRITEHPTSLVVARHEPATLNCQAEGNKPVIIEWYKDGEPVRTHSSDPKSQRVILPNGSLFFLRIVHGKKEQDAGTYWCVARNEYGKAVSQNATIEIAVLKEEFRLQPKTTWAAMGEAAMLDCQPPRGHPEPTVKWKKDGQLLALPTNRMHVADGGNLMISDVQQEDTGQYVCVAENTAGTRESPSAFLTVQVKPFLIKAPEDITAIANENVQFECKVGGDPAPNIIWRRQDGKMPIGRAQIQEDKSLKIEHVTPPDEGLYICEAGNPVGSITASATLIVHSRPTFLVTPKDQRVGLNGLASFECVTTGNPPPAVFWTKEGKQVLMFPGQPHGRFSVTSEGELKISGVRREDEGYYVCSALSVAGSYMAKAYLEVTALADLPPPIIRIGPANQTLPLKSLAMLPCQATGKPTPTIRWFMNSSPIILNNPRITMLDSGTLQIDDLQTSDSGMYTCTASSDSGETSWSATLSVESPTNPNIIFHRTPEPSNFPSPPYKPAVSNITETSVVLTWRRNPKIGASHLIGYTVEYFSSDLQTGWVVAAHRVPGESYLVQNLRPDTNYIFLVRAENSHGLGLPSPVSDTVRTLGLHRTLPDYDLDEARARLGNNVVELKEVKAMSSTSIRLIWEIKSAEEFVEGFYIRFRDMSGGSQKYNMVTVLNAGASSYIITSLRKFTKYEFFLVPFYKTIEGMPSNSRNEQTSEDVPSAPPDSVQVRILNFTSALIRWSPPPPQHRNGILRGYQILVKGNGSNLHSNLTTNATTTSVILNNLTAGATYSVRTAAYTTVGVGPSSSPVALRMDPSLLQISEHADDSFSQTLNDVVKQPWFIVMIGGLLCLILSILCIFLFFHRRAARKKALSSTLTAEELTRANMNAREALWIERGWRPIDMDKDSNLSETKLLNCTANDMNSAPDYAEVDTRNLKTFYKKEPPPVPAPYATTTLISSVQKRLNMPDGDRGFVPIPQGKDSSKTSGSDDSCVKTELSSDTNHTDKNPDGIGDHSDAASPTSDTGSYTTDDNGMLVLKKRLKPPLRTTPKQAVVNWSELLPPPPEHPPPGEMGIPSDSTQQYRCSSPANRGLNPQVAQGPSSPARVLSPNPLRGFHSPVFNKHPQVSPRATPTTHASGLEDDRGPTPPARIYKLSHHPTSNGTEHIPFNRGPLPPIPPQGPYVIISPTNSSMDRAIQSSLPSLISEPIAKLNMSANGPQLSIDFSGGNHYCGPESDVEGAPDYSDIEHYAQSGVRTPESSIAGGELDCSIPGSMLGTWQCVTDNSNSSCTSARSSAASSSDGSFYTEADFASAVVRAAENAGLRVDGSVVSDPNANKKHIQALRHRLQRSSSPYSSDSNYSSATEQHRPYPKTPRRKQFCVDGSQMPHGIPYSVFSNSLERRPYRGQGRGQQFIFGVPNSQEELPVYSKPAFPLGSSSTPSTLTAPIYGQYFSLRRNKRERGGATQLNGIGNSPQNTLGSMSEKDPPCKNSNNNNKSSVITNGRTDDQETSAV